MKTKLLILLMLAGSSLFAKTRVFVNVGFGNGGYGYGPPVYAYVPPSTELYVGARILGAGCAKLLLSRQLLWRRLLLRSPVVFAYPLDRS